MRDYVRLNFEGISQEVIDAGDRLMDLPNEECEIKKYKVVMKSTPGMYAQYKGHVEVFAQNEDDAIEAAHLNLKRTYPDRNRSMWKVLSVERIFD